ncbi:nucleotidyltransferase domain-containing protein [Ramlibacter sp. WS9]|nr:nucleotidyltransferase domain-containing protein [Ramlibacter sp. WS9]
MSRNQLPTGHDPLEGIGPNGAITTGAGRSNISQEFRSLLDKAIEHVNAANVAHSLYVYGSVATGTARVGSSDVDLVTIGLDAESARAVAATLTAAFPGLCRGAEIGPAQMSDYEGPSDEAYGNRVFLRHYCVHLTGPDVAAGLPAFPADTNAARGFNGDIGLRAERWRKELLDTTNPASLARRIARKTLFAVSGLVSIHDVTWTTDRIAAAHRWGGVRPHLAASLHTLIEWGGGQATPSRTEIQSALDGVVTDVVGDFKTRIGLWHQTRSNPRKPRAA